MTNFNLPNAEHHGDWLLRRVLIDEDNTLSKTRVKNGVSYQYPTVNFIEVIYDPINNSLLGKRHNSGHTTNFTYDICKKYIQPFGEELLIWLMSDTSIRSMNILDVVNTEIMKVKDIVEKHYLKTVFPYTTREFHNELAMMLSKGITVDNLGISLPNIGHFILPGCHPNVSTKNIKLPKELGQCRINLKSARNRERQVFKHSGIPAQLPLTYYRAGNKVTKSSIYYETVGGKIKHVSLATYLEKLGDFDDMFISIPIHIPVEAVKVWFHVDKPFVLSTPSRPNIGTHVHVYC